MTDDWRRFIQEVRHYWSLLHQKYKMTVPNKVHIIIDHVEDYIDATGQQQQLLGKHQRSNGKNYSKQFFISKATISSLMSYCLK